MPQVASDTVVSRPLRPESLSGRAGAPAGEPSSSFEGLLDTAPAADPRPARAERPTRARAADRSDQARPADDRSQTRTEARSSRDSSERANATTDKNSTKPADTPNTRQAKNGQSDQSSDTTQPAVNNSVAGAENAPVLVQAAEFAAIAEAVTVETAGDAKPVATGDTDKAAVTPDQAADGSAEANLAVAADTTTADIAAVIVAVAVPTAVNPLPAADPAAKLAGITPIEASAPAVPVDGVAPEAPIKPYTPSTADGTTPAKPQASADAATTEPGKTTPADESQKAAALKAAGLTETLDTKSSPRPDHKAESGKAKSDQRDGAVHTVDARASSGTALPVDAAADQSPKAPAPREPIAQAAEHIAPGARSAVGEARAEITTAAAGPAQAASNAPPLPFGLAAPALPFASLLPVTALRVDAAADNAVPVAGIAVEIVSKAQDGFRRFDIRLDPPELGRIDVRLDVDSGGKVTSRLIVERTETLDLLRRDAPQLERALQHAGLNTEGGLEFSLRDQNFANRDQAPRETAAARLIIPDDELAATEAARRGYGRMIGLGGGVDIRV